MGKSKLSRRITWHVIMIMVFFNVMIIGAVLFVCMKMSKNEAKIRAQHLTDAIDTKMETMLAVVEKTTSHSLTEVEEHLDSPEAVFAILEHELRLYPSYLCCFVGFEPDYYPSQGRWFEPYVSYIDSTTIERNQIGSAQHDYFNQEWYQKGLSLERGKSYLTDPYLDKDGAKRLVSSYVKPIYNSQGRKVGVYGIDINLNWLGKTIFNEEEKVKKVENVEGDLDDDMNAFFIQIINSKGKKIAGSMTFDEATIQTILNSDSIDFMRVMMDHTSFYITSTHISSTEWTLVVAQNFHFVYLFGYTLSIIILFFMTVGGFVIFFFTSRSIHRSVKPLKVLSNSAQEVAHGNFDTLLPVFKRQDEITQLRDSFDTMQQSLKQYVDDLKTTTTAKASIESELQVANKIQMSMLPRCFPKREGLDLYAEMTPAKDVGGDLYNFILRGDQLYICVGDVSGKGIPASLFMAQTSRLFRALAKEEGMQPADMACRMNDELAEGNDQCMFVTLFIGLVHLQTGRLDYCCCGHNAPVIDGEYLQMTNKNQPIGLMGGLLYKSESIDDIRGRQILIYTDGLNEAENGAFELLGNERLLKLMADKKALSAKEVIAQLSEAVIQYRDGAEPSDDLTIMCLRINE
jgi:sigma-B regulation protein RsbU (phosphoserine phosphatase)